MEPSLKSVGVWLQERFPRQLDVDTSRPSASCLTSVQSQSRTPMERESPPLEVMRSVPIMRHLLSRLQPADLAALAASCRTAATTVKQELPFIQHSLEQTLPVSVGRVASGAFCVHQWSTDSIQIPSPCGSRCLVATQVAGSLILEVLGNPPQTVEGQLLGLPCWSSDSTYVAVAVALPQHAVEASAQRTGRATHSLTQISFWNTRSQAWTPMYVDACVEDQADLAMLYWAPSTEHGYWVAATVRKTRYPEGVVRDNLLFFSTVRASTHTDSIQLATESTEREQAGTLSWSPDSSRIALAFRRHLWVRSAISQHQLRQGGVANNGQALAWAPSGSWVLCQEAFVSAGLEQLHPSGYVVHQPVRHSLSVAATLAACLALTWGTPGVVAVTSDALHIFSVKEGPILIPEHTRSLAFDATWVRIRVTRCTFDWAPGGQWLLCLLQLAEKDGFQDFTVLLIHPASGRIKSLPCQLRRAAKLSQNAAMRLATASQWAPDGCSAWVGVFDMDLEQPSPKDAFRQWLLRFK